MRIQLSFSPEHRDINLCQGQSLAFLVQYSSANTMEEQTSKGHLNHRFQILNCKINPFITELYLIYKSVQHILLKWLHESRQ